MLITSDAQLPILYSNSAQTAESTTHCGWVQIAVLRSAVGLGIFLFWEYGNSNSRTVVPLQCVTSTYRPRPRYPTLNAADQVYPLSINRAESRPQCTWVLSSFWQLRRHLLYCSVNGQGRTLDGSRWLKLIPTLLSRNLESLQDLLHEALVGVRVLVVQRLKATMSASVQHESVIAQPRITIAEPVPSVGSKRKRMAEPKFYAVRFGNTPGIYHSYPECLEQVKGFKRASCKYFTAIVESLLNTILKSNHLQPLPKRKTFYRTVCLEVRLTP